MSIYRGKQLLAGSGSISAMDIGLDKVNNTSDLEKIVKGLTIESAEEEKEMKPRDYIEYAIVANLKNSAGSGNCPIGVNGTLYSHILTINGMKDVVGSPSKSGWPTQLSIGEGGIAYRTASNSNEWNAWRKLADFQKYSGAGLPDDSLGNDGDIYIRYGSEPEDLEPGGSGTVIDEIQILKKVYPVGSIYFSTVNTNPQSTFGFGEWSIWGAGRVPVGFDGTQTEFNTAEKTGGAKTHKLTVTETPIHAHTQTAHTHTFTGNSHGHTFTGSAHNHGFSGYTDSANLDGNITMHGGAASPVHGVSGICRVSQNNPNEYRTGNIYSGSNSIQSIQVYATHSHSVTGTINSSTATGSNSNTTATGTNSNSTPTINNTGGDGTHNNLQPYITCYMWKRTA